MKHPIPGIGIFSEQNPKIPKIPNYISRQLVKSLQGSFGISSNSKRSWDFQALGNFFFIFGYFLDFFSFLGFFWEFPKSRGFSKIPGNSQDWDPTLFGKNPMGFKIPGIGIFFHGIGNSHEKATSG